MKKLALLLMMFLGLNSFAQIDFKTGNAELEASLNQINVEAKLDLNTFKAGLAVDFSVSKTDVDKLFSLKMQPAEVQLALSIGNITKKPVSQIADAYTKNKGKGWGYIAKEMGIKPGSPEFHALKGKCKKGKGSSNGKGNNGGGNGKGKGKK